MLMDIVEGFGEKETELGARKYWEKGGFCLTQNCQRRSFNK
jgi:hypothetical protein